MSTKTKTKIKKLPVKYRPLAVGEIIRISDEWKNFLGTWRPESKDDTYPMAGEPWRKTLVPYRRAIKHPAPKPAAKGRKAVKAGIVHMDKAGRCWAHAGNDTKRVAVIELSDEAALIEQVAAEIGRMRVSSASDWDLARAGIRSIGLIAKRRK